MAECVVEEARDVEGCGRSADPDACVAMNGPPAPRGAC